MDFITAVGLSIGILGGFFTVASISLGIIPWVASLSWASFYAAGGKFQGLKDVLITSVVGALWGYIILQLTGLMEPLLGETIGLGIAIFIGSTAICWQSKLTPLLSFIPGAFVGCAAFFGTDFNLPGTLIALVCGSVLGYLSELGAIALAKKEEEKIQI